jgi:hypothetical protein
MSNTPSDPDYINTKALEGFMRAFDHAVEGQYNLGTPNIGTPNMDRDALRKLMVEERERREILEQQAQAHQASFWYTFAPLKLLRRFRDTIRLRRYNREWSKNNPPMTVVEALLQASDVTRSKHIK